MDKRLVLGAIMIALFGLWCLGVVTREPYPAPIFPRFGSIPEQGELEPVRVQLLAFVDGQRRETITAGEAFPGAFDSFHPQMLDSLLRVAPDEAAADDEFRAWALGRARQRLGWDCAEALEVVEVVPDGSIPSRTLTRIELGGCR